MSVSSSPTSAPAPARSSLLADVYSFEWKGVSVHQSLVSASAVALCLFTGVALGHPGGALIAGGGALTIGFGINQRISDSRILPMLFGVFALGTATLAGTVAGHKGFSLILFSALSAAIYGVLTVSNAGIAWVGQQASVALFVASAFPSGPRQSLERAGLIVLGGLVQILVSSVGLKLFPELRRDFFRLPAEVREQQRQLWLLRDQPDNPTDPGRRYALIYALRLTVTVALASEIYRRLNMQSGYWVPMTALLVQKPAAYETLVRGLARVSGTLAGATLATLLVRQLHVPPATLPWIFAFLASLFALGSFLANPINYALFSLFLTSYIVFLLSLNQVPGPEIAHRRLWCTVAGATIAFVIHIDALRRYGRLRLRSRQPA